MNFLELVTKRHAARIYSDREITEKDLEFILECARLAPTAFNAQKFKLVVAQDKSLIKEIAEAAESPFVAKASAVIVAIGLDTEYKYNVVDISIVLDHVQLAAADREIGSCWVGTIGHDRVDKLLDIKTPAKVISIMSLGYDTGKILPKKRKSSEELFSFDKF